MAAIDAQDDLVAALETVTSVSGRVYPRTWPQGVVWPCITYQLIVGTAEQALDRTVGAYRDRWQIDLWAKREGDIQTMTAQVQAALLAMSGPTRRIISLSLGDTRDSGDPTNQLRHRIQEVWITHV